jgi:hypothetical protein
LCAKWTRNKIPSDKKQIPNPQDPADKFQSSNSKFKKIEIWQL